MLPTVCEAGEQLLDDLRRGEALTRGWSQEKEQLGDAVVDAALSRCLARLATTGLWGEPNRIPSSELWRIGGPWLETGWLQHRARFKPLGYAGDFEMLARICEKKCCEDPLGRLFDRYFLRQAAPAAVRARTVQIAHTLVAECLGRGVEPYRVVSVGAGPALDIDRAVALLPEVHRDSLRVTLLDIDPKALDFARRRLELRLAPDRVRCERANLARLCKTAGNLELLGSPDLLVCSGLLDYMTDQAATELLAGFWERLSPGGLLLVGNFSLHNATRAYMEWIGNWYLVYRTPQQMAHLAVAAGIPAGQFTIHTERLGVVLFVAGRKG